MDAFDNVAFPLAIALNSVAGPEFSTDVTETAGGFETRNQNWAGARLRFNVAPAVRDLADYETLRAFFYGRAGRARGFRFRDWSDHRSSAAAAPPAATDQLLGVGDGARIFWQLVKSYPAGPVTYQRRITRPVAGTVLVALAGVPRANGWTVDTATGIITFATPPAAGVAVTAGYLFDVPARFDLDRLEPVSVTRDLVQLPDLPVVEIRE